MSVIDDEFPRFNNDYFCNCDSIIEKKLSKNNIVTWHLIDARLLIIIVATIDYYYLFSHLVVSLYHCVEYSLVFRLYIYLYLCIYILLHTFSLSMILYIYRNMTVQRLVARFWSSSSLSSPSSSSSSELQSLFYRNYVVA